MCVCYIVDCTRHQEMLLAAFLSRVRGGGVAPLRKAPRRIAVNFLLSFCGMLLLSVLHFGLFHSALGREDLVLLIGSQGAAAVRVFAAPDAPLAQPPNVILGNLMSGFIGVSVSRLRMAIVDDTSVPATDEGMMLAVPLAVSLAILAMDLTNTLHPPGGATSLIAVVGSSKVRALGWWYPLMPAGLGSLLLVLLAALGNNVWGSGRAYPKWWIGRLLSQPSPPQVAEALGGDGEEPLVAKLSDADDDGANRTHGVTLAF